MNLLSTSLKTMPRSKIQPADPLAKARATAEELGARVGILMNLAKLSPETEERIFVSLQHLSLKDIRRVHDALEARIVMHAREKAYARFEEELQTIAREYNEKEQKAALNFCNDLLASELEEEYV